MLMLFTIFIPLLAEATTEFSYQGIGWLVVGLSACAVAANQIDDFFDRRKSKTGTPPNEQLEQSHDDLERRVGNIEVDMGDIKEKLIGQAWFDKIENDIKDLRAADSLYRENKDRADSIHRSSLYKAIEGSRKELHTEIGAMNDRMEKLPERVIALLRNTGAIGKGNS